MVKYPRVSWFVTLLLSACERSAMHGLKLGSDLRRRVRIISQKCTLLSPCRFCMPAAKLSSSTSKGIPATSEGVSVAPQNAPEAPEEKVSLQDPLEALGEDVLLRVLGVVDAVTLARCGAVSQKWKAVAELDLLWESRCVELWQGKVHLPMKVLGAGCRKEAYAQSLLDGRRAIPTSEDLCSHLWEFRFKEVAGDYWLALDPSWRGQPPLTRQFLPEGVVLAGPACQPVGPHECRWQFTRTKEGRPGLFVRINHWPSLVPSRTPDWGWHLENCWVRYSSVPDNPYLGRASEVVSTGARP